MENTDPNIARIQHVAKSSSDQLLRKFAEAGSDNKDLRLAKRINRKVCNPVISNCNSSLADKKSLLVPAKVRKSCSLIRKLGVSKAQIRAREIKNKSVISVLEKTWRRTVEGASRVLMEKHYNRHKRLTNDSF